MRKKYSCLFLAAGVFLVPLSYYLWAIHDARSHTQSHIAAAYAQWGSGVEVSSVGSKRMDWLLAVEDPAFFSHQGVDLETPGAGMTTLTQGLAKLLYYPNGFKPGFAKIRQTLIARYALDELVSKEEQLRLFLNIAYLGAENGKPVRGFGAASKVYFGKSLPELTDREFLSLVAMLIGPNARKPGTPENLRRVKSIEGFLAGKIVPASVLDVEYEGKRSGSLAEEAAMAFLRLITA
ncbi:MAG: transglycosylase domain-containing protein [Candidatus Accumulibacter sp.]|jgi:membrane carboxypeptidase/penicillin-binding protein|nr:transglycosylase domain-containing protein [Accumulibacter sp.]